MNSNKSNTLIMDIMSRLTPKFNHSATKNPPPFDFGQAVAEAYALFPEVKEKVFFIDVDAGKVVHPDTEIRERLVAAINANEDMRTDLNIEMYKRKGEKSSAVMEIGDGKDAVYFVFLYLQKDMTTALGGKHDLSENQHLVFDHETAHAVLKQAHGPKLLSESTADAYAALRHFQRYGTENGTIEKLMKRRAALGFMNQDGEHFTSPALEKVLSQKGKVDFDALSPAATAKLATRLAKQSALTPEALKKLSRSFNKLRKPMLHVTDDTPLRQLAEMSFGAREENLRKWSKIALRAFVDKDIALKTDTKKIRLTGPYWKNVRQQLRKTG